MAAHKLLLADDSVTIQKVVNLTFADEDIEVITVGDGDAAMRKFTEDQPDLVLADVNMPGLDGYRICEMIKQDDETKHIPVVLLAGSFEPFDEERARQVGANDFLTKPFQSIRQLANKVSDLLDHKNDKNEVDSFADTLENIPAEKETEEIIDDGESDDEMIQTNQIGSLPINEPQKFTSKGIYQPAFEDTDIDSIEPPYDFSKAIENGNQTKNQTAEIENAEDKISAVESLSENNNLFAPEDKISDQLNEELEQILKNKHEADEAGDEFPDFALDDFDLLELPQSKNGASKIKRFYGTSEAINLARQNLSGTFAESSNDLSPEIIEAIADKVVEKLSGEVIAKVVREVIAQIEKEK